MAATRGVDEYVACAGGRAHNVMQLHMPYTHSTKLRGEYTIVRLIPVSSNGYIHARNTNAMPRTYETDIKPNECIIT